MTINKNDDIIEREKFDAHAKAYWNHLDGNKIANVTDMRLLFYDDPRTLLTDLIYGVTGGTMNCTKEQFEFIKMYLRANGQKELADSITGEQYEK